MSNTLRSKIIRLAHQHPDLREHLLPLVKKSSAPVQVDWKKGVAIFKSPGVGTLMVKPDRWLPNGSPSVYGNPFLSSILDGVWREWSGENQAEDDPMSDFVGFQPNALVTNPKPVALHLDNQEWQALMDRAQSTGSLHLAKGKKQAKEYIREFNKSDWSYWGGSRDWDSGVYPLAGDIEKVDFEAMKRHGTNIPAGEFTVNCMADPDGGTFVMYHEESGDDFTFIIQHPFRTQEDARRAMENWLGELGQGQIPQGFQLE